MTTDFTPTGTPLVNGMVDPQHPWVLWITRPDGKVEAYGYPPTDAGNNQLLADYRTAKQLGLSPQSRLLPPETKPMSFDALRGLSVRRAQYTRAFRNSDRDLMARCLAWGAENGFSAEEIAGDNSDTARSHCRYRRGFGRRGDTLGRADRFQSRCALRQRP